MTFHIGLTGDRTPHTDSMAPTPQGTPYTAHPEVPPTGYTHRLSSPTNHITDSHKSQTEYNLAHISSNIIVTNFAIICDNYNVMTIFDEM